MDNKKEKIYDEYDLINSKVISEYCRSIKHKFNTEELAVLVYRNKRMTIEEKIKKYTDLINNYPDMEVIERINCKHYDNAKIMIKEEIQRLNNVYKELTKDDSDSICVWTEYDKSTLRYSYSNDIMHTFRTYKETFEDIQNYIKENDDTLSFKITKKYFNKNEEIYARYIVENKKIKLINIENSTDILDIDQIFLNIPTPFKKGDILVSKSRSMFNYGDYSDIFVLDYLCTWRDGLEELLTKGNYDSSDMIGYGYYLYGENSTELVLDSKWDYDSFEYYDKDLQGNERILKGISSLIKNEIGIDTFLQAYEYIKSDNNNLLNMFTEEGLQLAGLTAKDIHILSIKREYDNRAEQVILGNLLVGKQEVINEVINIINVRNFENPNHRKIYEAILSLYNENKKIDIISINQKLNDRFDLEFLANLTEVASEEPNVKYYIDSLKNRDNN